MSNEKTLHVGQLVDVEVPGEEKRLMNCRVIEIERSRRDFDWIKIRWSYQALERPLEIWANVWHVDVAPRDRSNKNPVLVVTTRRRSAA